MTSLGFVVVLQLENKGAPMPGVVCSLKPCERCVILRVICFARARVCVCLCVFCVFVCGCVCVCCVCVCVACIGVCCVCACVHVGVRACVCVCASATLCFWAKFYGHCA